MHAELERDRGDEGKDRENGRQSKIGNERGEMVVMEEKRRVYGERERDAW